jgi:hypothetical protein
MLESVYSEAKQLHVPRKMIRELLAEWKKEYGDPPKNLTGLIEGVAE